MTEFGSLFHQIVIFSYFTIAVQVHCVLSLFTDANMLLAGDDQGFVWLYDLSNVQNQLPDPEERDRKGPLELRHSKV